MKSLEALKRIRQETCLATYNDDFDKNECCDTIEKELKALEIIKKRRVDCLVVVLSQTYVEYNDMCETEQDKLTKEEYDLLKEEFFDND